MEFQHLSRQHDNLEQQKKCNINAVALEQWSRNEQRSLCSGFQRETVRVLAPFHLVTPLSFEKTELDCGQWEKVLFRSYLRIGLPQRWRHMNLEMNRLIKIISKHHKAGQILCYLDPSIITLLQTFHSIRFHLRMLLDRMSQRTCVARRISSIADDSL